MRLCDNKPFERAYRLTRIHVAATVYKEALIVHGRSTDCERFDLLTYPAEASICH